MKKLFAFLLIALTSVGCSKDSVVVRYDEGKVRLTAVDDNIIRVEAVPSGEAFPKTGSLSVIRQSGRGRLEVDRDGGFVIARTGSVTAKVDAATGQVAFFDADGNPVVREHGREFSPIEVEGTKGWTVRQTFDADADEGFFGLGQHQADEWNYKGRNEELYQYNTKISVPFIVSSKKYGILWESTSFCRWGDPRDYRQLDEVFTLYDRQGVEGALTGTYHPSSGEALVRREKALNQEYLRTPQCDLVVNSPEGFDFNGSHVVFEGSIEAGESGLFHFYMYYAGYTKVFVDGKQVMPDLWRTAWNPNGRKFEYEMEAGRKTALRIEWEPDGGVSYCALKVLPPLPAQEQERMSWWGEMQDGIDYYYIASDDVDGVISGYRTLTGKAPVLPKWALGYWQSRERYTSQEQILSVLGEFRAKGIPIDNIVQDWQYWEPDQWGSHEFDATRFPDPKGMVDSIHAMNGRYMISVWPKFYEGTEHFRELDRRGWIYRTAIDEKVIDWLGYSQSFYDAYSAGARKLFWKQMYDHLYPLGVDSWWMDASEPNIHDCTDMDYRKKMAGPTAMGPAAKYLNAYALLNAEAIYNGQRSADPDRRVFLLTRNGFSGLQRYSTASWSGDIGTTWLDMKAQISAGLNYCISGLPFWGQDIGGFTSEFRFQKAQELFERTGVVNDDLKEWRELNARWHEWGVFCPLYRAHGQYPFREPWNIAPEGSETFNAIVATDRMRYRLMPYIYSLVARIHFDDYTLMRPLVMDFTDDPIAREVSDQFMFGDAIMVCPVYEYKARSREVYLPEGGWYDLSDGHFIDGLRHFTAEAPYDRIPLYARAGSIIVSGEDIRSTSEVQKNLTVNVFEGEDAEFTLYEDDGVSYDYEKGAYATVTFNWNDGAKTLRISEIRGDASFVPEGRKYTVRLFSPRGTETASVRYDGAATEIRFRNFDTLKGKELFNNGWKFSLGNAASKEEDFTHGTEYFTYFAKVNSNDHNRGPAWSGFDDSSWKSVNLPHDWVVDLPYSGEASHSHGYKCVGWKYPENSVGWYRKRFAVPVEAEGTEIGVEFEGIFRDAEVFCNGIYLGHERSGYAVQYYDLTDILNYGGENVITVRCDASLEEGWYYEGAGIYRNVWLHKGGRCPEKGSGARNLRFDPDRGFLLDGKRVQLRGCDLHLDAAGVGTAVPKELWRYRLNILKEYGFNCIRSSHNPASEDFLDLCDEMGFFLIDENRCFGSNDEQLRGLENMIAQHKHHPCIIAWSVGNEEWSVEWDDRGTAIARAMTDRAHAADPSRPTTYGSSGGQAPNYGVDVFGYNYIVQNPIERNHSEFPRNCALGTEETTGCGTRGVYETVPEEGWMIPHNRRDSIDHIETGWRFYKERPWLAGLCYWTGFDYRGESNPMVWPATGSQFGIFDYCGFPKDEAYYLKAWWTGEPVLHICGPAAGRVRVYSNCTIVELFADGVSLGAREMPRDSHLDWDVPGTASVFTAKGICADGRILTDVYPEVVEGTELKVSKKAMKADGQDVVIIDIVSGQPVLDVCVEGAQFLGWGNGNPGFKEIERPVSGNSLRIRTFNGRAQVIIRSIEGMNGAVRVTVRDAKGLRAAVPAVIACGECPDSELVEKTMEAMTLREKVCQMFVLRPQAVANRNFFRDYPAGGFCLFAGDIVSPEQTLELTSELHSLPYRPLLCVDEEGGRVARIAGNGAFGLKRIPGMAALASDNDARKVYNAARYIGEYVRRYGFDVDFAPVADVNTNPENVVIGDRAFSDNPGIAARMVESYLRGLSEEGVTGCLKHFPGHGDTKNDTHAGYAQSLKTWDEMKECEMVTFRAGIAAGAEMIMTAHIAAPAVTGSDVPSTMSEVILGEKLRGELGFGGIIVTDALEMGAITSKYGPSEAALNALKAGADLILMPVDFVQAVDSIIDAVQSGEISEERIDGSVRRILTLKAKSQKTI